MSANEGTVTFSNNLIFLAFANLYGDEATSDLILILPQLPNFSILTHKFVLASNSQFLYNFLFGANALHSPITTIGIETILPVFLQKQLLQEKQGSSKLYAQIAVPVQFVVQYCYFQKISFENISTSDLKVILAVALHWQIEDLIKLVLLEIKSNHISGKTVCELWPILSTHCSVIQKNDAEKKEQAKNESVVVNEVATTAVTFTAADSFASSSSILCDILFQCCQVLCNEISVIIETGRVLEWETDFMITGYLPSLNSYLHIKQEAITETITQIQQANIKKIESMDLKEPEQFEKGK